MINTPSNLIFVCVFNQHQYVEMLYLLLESVYFSGQINDNTKILIYTSTPFMNMIKESDLNSDVLIFHTNDTYKTLDTACKARLDLFSIPCVKNFKKILYLDTDILIIKDINPIFDLIQDDKMYAVQEGNIADGRGWWGLTLFQDEINNYDDKVAFSSGILLFNNSTSMIELFQNIKKDIDNRPQGTNFHDQPYFIYNAFKHNMINKRRLELTCGINDDNIFSMKTILHFAGCPGVYEKKIPRMRNFLATFLNYNINKTINLTKQIITSTLMPIIHEIDEPLEGNVFMWHETTEYTDRFIEKAKNISNLARGPNIKNILEIGFNAGFSALLILISNPNIHLTCMDIAEHKYTMPCYNVLKEMFGQRITFIKGDTLKTLPTVTDSFDLIHIDGGHSDELVINDIQHSYRIAHDKTILLMDDYEFPNIRELWHKYIAEYKLHGISAFFFATDNHDARLVSK